MEGILEIKTIADGVIEIAGITYVTNKYCQTMMDRSFYNGMEEARKENVHTMEVLECPKCFNPNND